MDFVFLPDSQSAMRIRPRLQCFCAYAFLQGLTPSIIRAVIMTSIFLVGELLSATFDRRNTLYITAFLMLLFDPYMIYSIGLQLSFGAVLGIILFAAPIDNYLVRVVKVKKLSSLISVSIAAQIFDIAGFWRFILTKFRSILSLRIS